MGEIIQVFPGPRRMIKFSRNLIPALNEIGIVPLPPYILEKLDNPDRYQTVYAQEPGSVAAPTAGLHFTNRLIEKLSRGGINFAFVTLHVGLDTFSPVIEEIPSEHTIHSEWCKVSSETVRSINQTKQKGRRVIAVGTTSVRALESAGKIGDGSGVYVNTFEGPTDLFILPGYNFKIVDAMITNFHLPRSSLIMLVSAFVGNKKILDLYELAKSLGYRFYSFGDAMLIM
jgi:S-adenosylmethionine:tRNA ribosyltransferase-isomerase